MACQHITHIWLQKAEYPALLHESPVELCLVYCHCFVLKKHYFLKSSRELIAMSLSMILLKILFINYNAWYSLYKDPWEKYLFSLSTRKAVFFLRICVCVCVCVCVILWKLCILWLSSFIFAKKLGSKFVAHFLFLHQLRAWYHFTLCPLCCFFFFSSTQKWAFAVLYGSCKSLYVF